MLCRMLEACYDKAAQGVIFGRTKPWAASTSFEKDTYLMSKKPSPNKIGRDARTGQYIPVREAERRPSTTVVETRPRPCPPTRKK